MYRHSVLLLGVLFLCLGGCRPQNEASSPQMPAENPHKATVHVIYEAFNTGNTAPAEALIAADVVDHQMMPGVSGPGPEQFRQSVEIFRTAFPDLHVTTDLMIAEGDLVAIHYTMRGTHQGPFMGNPATGKTFEASGIDLIRFENGKIVEHWGYEDDLGMMQQLGMMPAEMAAPGENR